MRWREQKRRLLIRALADGATPPDSGQPLAGHVLLPRPHLELPRGNLHPALKAKRPRDVRVNDKRVCLCVRAEVGVFLLRNGRVLPICASLQPPHPWPMKRETTALPCTLPPSVSLTTPSHSSLLSSCPPTEKHTPTQKLSVPYYPPSLSFSLLSGWLRRYTAEGALKWCNIHPHHHLHCQHRGRLPLGLKPQLENKTTPQGVQPTLFFLCSNSRLSH